MNTSVSATDLVFRGCAQPIFTEHRNSLQKTIWSIIYYCPVWLQAQGGIQQKKTFQNTNQLDINAVTGHVGWLLTVANFRAHRQHNLLIYLWLLSSNSGKCGWMEKDTIEKKSTHFTLSLAVSANKRDPVEQATARLAAGCQRRAAQHPATAASRCPDQSAQPGVTMQGATSSSVHQQSRVS